MAPNPIDDDDLYDAIILAGKRSPGVVKLSGHDRKIEWDVKDGPGLDGASMTRKSGKPAPFNAAFYLADADDFAAWPAFAALIKSTVAGATPKALEVYHPDLAANDIKSVVMASLGGAVHDGKGGVTYTVGFIEYKPPKPKGGSPTAKDPNADLQAEIAKLTKQYKDTKWG